MARALLVNPWIHDFAAHDVWLRPLGLLRLAGYLRSEGVQVDFIDCLDTHHPSMADKHVRRGPYGKGKFHKAEIQKPSLLSWFPRRYSRYGITPSVLDAEIGKLPRPDVILMTTGMTYWYPGVVETIAHCRKVFQNVPIVIGGIYATLCYEHAKQYSGADHVIRGGQWLKITQVLETYLSISPSEKFMETVPAWDLVPKSESVVVKTSEGCPFRCSYCATGILTPVFSARPAEDVVDEILFALRSTQANDLAFYDDALLWEAETRITVILEKLNQSGVSPRFHCPNGLHVRFVTPELARKMREAGFRTIRLGLESAHSVFHERTGKKLQLDEFRQAVDALQRAGYPSTQIGAYVMVGLPGQTLQEVEESIRYVLSTGAIPYLSEYSPIPGTPLWGDALKRSPFPLEEEPLFHNNTLLPCHGDDMDFEAFLELKSSLQRYRSRLASL